MNSYESKQEAKRERLERAADNAERKADERVAASDAAVAGIPFGQPILVGHHSEKAHRNRLKRSQNAMFKSVELRQDARDFRRRAAAIGSGGISSDDPEAASKLYQKIAAAKATQHNMKAANSIIRARDHDNNKIHRLRTELLFGEATARALLEPDFMGRLGFASYQLQNNGANIRRMEKRLEELRQRPTETTETERNGVTIVENADENRIQLIFDGKPSAEVRQILKSQGFRWSRYNTAWQRHLTAAGRYAASSALDRIEALN